MIHTPATPEGLRKHDRLSAQESVVRAWGDPGRHPGWHEAAKGDVRRAMPLLARALDRLAKEADDDR